MPSDNTQPDYPTPDSIRNGSHIPTDSHLAIIAGSRTAEDHASKPITTLIANLITQEQLIPDVVISGTADGVDKIGEQWATEEHDLPVAQFPAPWNDTDHEDAVVKTGRYGKYDAKAGFRRNKWMAKYANQHGATGYLIAILAYEDGEPSNGTSHMIETGRDILGDENVYVVPVGQYEGNIESALEPVIYRLE